MARIGQVKNGNQRLVPTWASLFGHTACHRLRLEWVLPESTMPVQRIHGRALSTGNTVRNEWCSNSASEMPKRRAWFFAAA